MRINGLKISGWFGALLFVLVIYIAYRFGMSRGGQS